MMRLQRILFLLIPLLLVGSVACSSGDDDNSDSDTGTTSSVPTTAPNSSPVVVASTIPGVTSSPVAAQPTIAQGGAAAATDACGLLSKDDAAAGLGESVRDPLAVTLGTQAVGPGITVSMSSCVFDASNGPRTVSVNYWKAAGNLAPQLRQAAEQVFCVGKERVSGLGDFACWGDSTHAELLIVKGSGFIDVQITGATTNRAAALQTLAQKVLTRVQ
jgi:hypothetical protein